MNLLGLEIKFAAKDNNKYVIKEECHQAQDLIRQEMRDNFNNLRLHFDVRIDDLKDFFLKNGR